MDGSWFRGTPEHPGVVGEVFYRMGAVSMKFKERWLEFWHWFATSEQTEGLRFVMVYLCAVGVIGGILVLGAVLMVTESQDSMPRPTGPKVIVMMPPDNVGQIYQCACQPR